MFETQIQPSPLVVASELIIDPVFLEELKPVSRNNIRTFVGNCAERFNLARPFVDVACGYRTNQPEAVRSHNGIIDPLYIAFDHTLNFDRPPEPSTSPNLIADATSIPLAYASVGTVLCTEVLEHVPDDQAVVAEISRILRRGGRLIITLPGRNVPKHEKLPNQRDYRRYRPDDVRKMLGKHEFKKIEVYEKFLDDRQINLLVTAEKK